MQACWVSAVCPSSRLSISCGSGVAGGVARCTGKQPSHSVWPTNPYSSTRAPSWADVVRNGVRVSAAASLTPPPTPTSADFIKLYERSMASGLQAHFSISHSGGPQNISVHCNFSASTPASRHHCRCGKATDSAAPRAAPPITAPPISAPPISARQVPALVPLHPQTPTAPSLPLTVVHLPREQGKLQKKDAARSSC
jgi:hypothetical protein